MKKQLSNRRWLVVVVVFMLGLLEAGTASAAPYSIDRNGRLVAAQDFFLTCDLDAGIKMGILVMTGSSFNTQELYNITHGVMFPVTAAAFQACPYRKVAQGPNAAVLLARKAQDDIRRLQEQYRQQAREQARQQEIAARRHPDVPDALQHELEMSIIVEGGRLIRSMLGGTVDRIRRKNHW